MDNIKYEIDPVIVEYLRTYTTEYKTNLIQEILVTIDNINTVKPLEPFDLLRLEQYVLNIITDNDNYGSDIGDILVNTFKNNFVKLLIGYGIIPQEDIKLSIIHSILNSYYILYTLDRDYIKNNINLLQTDDGYKDIILNNSTLNEIEYYDNIASIENKAKQQLLDHWEHVLDTTTSDVDPDTISYINRLTKIENSLVKTKLFYFILLEDSMPYNTEFYIKKLYTYLDNYNTVTMVILECLMCILVTPDYKESKDLVKVFKDNVFLENVSWIQQNTKIHTMVYESMVEYDKRFKKLERTL